MKRAPAVERASVEDASAIYALLVEAFASSYLRYTIYQSTLAVNYIGEQIGEGINSGAPRFWLMRRENRVVGFYHAVERNAEFFLNNIVTAESEQGEGLGRLLLEHFEAEARSRRCATAGLHAFSTSRVVPWYQRHGYAVGSAHYLALVRTSTVPETGGERMAFDREDLENALLQERRWGFGGLDVMLRGLPARLGLVAQRLWNVLSPSGEAAIPVVSAIPNTFAEDRRWALVRTSDLAVLESALTVDSAEQSLYMTKAIRSTQP